jgi:carboxypeptidase Q
MKNLVFFLLFVSGSVLYGQNSSDEEILRSIYSEALQSYEAYHNLEWLCKNTKGRICGTPEAAAAVEFTYQTMLKMDLDSVWKQDVLVKNWKRGEPEKGRIASSWFGTTDLAVCALGMSPGTGPDGLVGEVIEFLNFEELEANKELVTGKIVFFNRPMDQKIIQTFGSYGGAVNQRTSGPAIAAKFGAIACIVRSLSIELDDFPHTGVTRFDNENEKVPAFAVSTNGAEILSRQLKTDPNLKLYLRSTCQTYPDVPSHNVIGEIRGTDYPNEIITVGGHLDAWDNSEGAHDDGGGCMQSIEVLRLFLETGIRPKHTIRAVMFMDEEIAQRGGEVYKDEALRKGEKHIAAMESDRGLMSPRNIAIGTSEARYNKAMKWESLFKPYDLHFMTGGGGADIGPLRTIYPDIVFLSMIPDNQRYFTFHHSPNDTFEQVNRREMQMGSATMASIVYLFDKYGL